MNRVATKKNHLKWLLPIVILIGAALGASIILRSGKTPEKKPPLNAGLMVETTVVVRQPERAIVHATGTAEPQQEISVVAEVSGKMTWLSSSLVEGGFFRKGEKLLEIDPRDYQLAIQKAEAELARARTGLQTEEEQSAIAQREWNRLEFADKGFPGALVLRQPQLNSAKADLSAAQATLDLAKLNLERTRIYAPFNGRISSKKVDLGEYVRSGNPLATFAGTDYAEIIVPLPVENLAWLKIPKAGSNMQGSNCTISAQVGDKRYQWQGHVMRSFGEIDSNSRMAKIAIRVEDPYNLKPKKTPSSIPLANGLFVELSIEGEDLGPVTRIPRSALREGDLVWLADQQDHLEIRPVHVLRRQQQDLLIDQGLQGGERLILTSITGAAADLKLRPQSREQQP